MALTPMPGDYVRIFKGSGSDSDYSNEEMEEVDLSDAKWGGYAANTVWRIADADKRIMNDSAVPTFEYDPLGGTDWEPLTPLEIWYGAGYIITADLGASAVVRCASGKYLTPTEIIGCATRSTKDKTLFQECTCFGDTAAARAPTIDDWEGSLEAFVAKKQAELTSGTGNSAVLLRHIAGGVAGNSITLTITDTDQAALTVSVSTNDITVDLKTSGGSPVSTALEVINAINADADCQALGVHAFVPAGSTGAGVVAAAAKAPLAGGLDYIDYPSLLGAKVALRSYIDYTNGEMYVGLGYVESVDWIGKTDELLKAGLTIRGHKYPMRHVIETP